MFGRYGNTGGSGGSGSSGSGISDAEKKDFNEISTLTTEPTPANFKNGITVIKYNDKLYVLNDAGEVTSVGEDQCIGFFDKYGDLPNDTSGEFKNKLAFVREQDGARRAGVYIGMGKNLAWIAQYNFLTRDEHVIATVDDNYEHYGNGMGKKRYAISDFGDLMEATTSSLDPSTNSHLIEPTNDWGYAITNNIADHFTGLGAIKKGFRLTASTDKKINFDIGTVYAFIRGENRIMSTIIHGKDNALFTVINQAGIVTDSTDIINVEDWDNSGRNETLSANACTFSTFYLNYKTKKLYQLIGQKVYSTKEEALNNYRFETRLTPAVIENDTICLGGVITSASDTIIDSSYIIHSNKLGEIIELTGGSATTSVSGYNRMFLPLGILNPTNPQAPTKQEVKDTIGDIKGVLLYYTGTNNKDDPSKFVYMIDDNKEMTVIEKPMKDGVIIGHTDTFPSAKGHKNDYFILTKNLGLFNKGIYKSDGVNWLFVTSLPPNQTEKIVNKSAEVDPFDFHGSTNTECYLFDSFLPRRKGTGVADFRMRLHSYGDKDTYSLGGGVNNKSFASAEVTRLSTVNDIDLNDKSFAFSFWIKLTEKKANDASSYMLGTYHDGNGVSQETLHVGYRRNDVFTVAFWLSDVNFTLDSKYKRVNQINKWLHVGVIHDSNTLNTTLTLNGNKIRTLKHNKPFIGKWDSANGARGHYGGAMIFSNLRVFVANKSVGVILSSAKMKELYDLEYRNLIDD